MRTFNRGEMKMGWFIGDFEPSVLRTKEFEVAHHTYKKGFKGEPHIHKVATEYNYVVTGHVKIKRGPKNETYIKSGAGFIFEPNEYFQVEYLEDTELIIIKTPSVIGDKYPI